MKCKFNYRFYYVLIALVLSIIVVFSGLSGAIAFPTLNHQNQLESIESSNKVYSLSGTWQFMPEASRSNHRRIVSSQDRPLKIQPTKQLPKLPQQQWQDIKVPANWWLEGQDLDGIVWYKHQFKTTPNLQDKLVKLVFSGVDYTADVWLNGRYLGFHEGYFQPFSFLINEQLNSQGDNELIVRVNSP